MATIIDAIQTESGKGYINYEKLENKPNLQPYKTSFVLTPDETNDFKLADSEENFDTLKALFDKGRSIYLVESDSGNNYFLSEATAETLTFFNVALDEYLIITKKEGAQSQKIYKNSKPIQYSADNGVEITEKNSIELIYGKTIYQDKEEPLQYINFTAYASGLDSDSGLYTYYIGEPMSTEIVNEEDVLYIYYIQNDQEILIGSGNKENFISSDSEYYIGFNTVEQDNLYDLDNFKVKSYTIKDSSIPVHGILKISINSENRRIDRFKPYTSESALTGVITIKKKNAETATIPQAMERIGKTKIKKVHFGSSMAELASLSAEELSKWAVIQYGSGTPFTDAIYGETKQLLTDFQSKWELNSTYSSYPIYNNTTYGFNGNTAVISQLTFEECPAEIATKIRENGFYFNFYDINGYQHSFSSSSDIESISFARIDISESIADIFTNCTWSSENGVLLMLCTTINRAQFILPIVCTDHPLISPFVFCNIDRYYSLTEKNNINSLPIYQNGSTDGTYLNLNETTDSDNLLTTEQIRYLILSYSPTPRATGSITNSGDDASLPVISSAIYEVVTSLQNDAQNQYNSLSEQISNVSAGIDAKLTWENIQNKPTIPTLTFDAEPISASTNLLTSGTIYTMQQNLIEQINGKAKGYVFDTNTELTAWLADSANKSKLKIGDVLYIRETGYPDYWWDGTSTQYLETQKVDLTDYAKTEAVTALENKVNADLKNYQLKSNRDVYNNFYTVTTDKDSTYIASKKNTWIECSAANPMPFVGLANYSLWKANEMIQTLVLLRSSDRDLGYFRFNQLWVKNKTDILTFPEGAPAGNYFQSEILPIEFITTEMKNGGFVFLQLYVQYMASDTIPKVYLKSTNISTADIVISDTAPTSNEATDNTITFVKEETSLRG